MEAGNLEEAIYCAYMHVSYLGFMLDMSMNTGPANVRELHISCSDTWIRENKSYVFTFPGGDFSHALRSRVQPWAHPSRCSISQNKVRRAADSELTPVVCPGSHRTDTKTVFF